MVVAFRAYQRLQAGQSLSQILDEDVHRIRAVRDAVGSDADLYIDANQALDPYHARMFIEQINDLDIGFFEEPIRGNDIPAMADFRRVGGMPIAAGQNEGHVRRGRDMLKHQAVDILQFNVCIGGGYTTCQKIAAMAKAFNIPVDNGGAWPQFNKHLHAGLANGGMTEWHMAAVALERVLYASTTELEADALHLSDKPGVGFELIPEVIKDSII
jgi:L-alanine-DL-glutamate epimerase-like enolase superfamily enzyme